MPLVAVGGVLIAAGASAGCESTQAKSARLERAAAARAPEKGLAVGKPSRDVRAGKATVIRDENGTALVVELCNRSSRPLARVPLGVRVLGDGRKPVYANDTPGIERSLVSAALLPAKRTTLWVNDQVAPSGTPRSATVVAGARAQAVKGRPPRVSIARTTLVRDPTSGVSVTGKVTNRSAIDQRDLVVFVAASKGGRFVAAGRAVVRRLRARATAPFTAFLIGDPRGGRLHAVAPPTTLR